MTTNAGRMRPRAKELEHRMMNGLALTEREALQLAEAMLDCICQGGNFSMLAWRAAMNSIHATMAEHDVERI